MRKAWMLTALLLAVFGLSQCSLFSTTVEYEVTTGSSAVSLSIQYQNEEGTLVEISTTTAYWSYSFDLPLDEKPFLAWIQVTNYNATPASINIRKDGAIVDTGVTSNGVADDAWVIID